jgi:hypothetical protein
MISLNREKQLISSKNGHFLFSGPWHQLSDAKIGIKEWILDEINVKSTLFIASRVSRKFE